ncbi:MAG: creatininase family protein, partial [Thermotogae bacterium]
GKATAADAEKAKDGVEALLDYLEKLVNDIIETFPAGKLPPANELSQRSEEELKAAMKKPFEPGWRSIYSLGNMW